MAQPAKDLTKLHAIAKPHIESFNYFLEEGLPNAVADLDPIEVEHGGRILQCTFPVIFPRARHERLIYGLFLHAPNFL